MGSPEFEAAERHFIEDVAIVFEQSGLPRMAGRIMGWLLISDPPQQSTAQIAMKLGASKGSVSTMTRLLMRMGAIEMIGVAGERSKFFRMNPNAISRLFDDGITRLAAVRELSERGLALLNGREPRLLDRLETMRAFYSFLEQETRATICRWRDEVRPTGR